MINTVVSRGPAALTPGRGDCFGLFAFDTGDALAVQKHRNVPGFVPGAVGRLVHFVHPQTSAAVQVDPDGEWRWRGGLSGGSFRSGGWRRCGVDGQRPILLYGRSG